MIAKIFSLIWIAGSITVAADTVELKSHGALAVHAGTQHFVFDLVDTTSRSPLTDADLKIAHEKKLHFLVYDSALAEFRHVHPEFIGGAWQVDFDLPVNGAYWLWAQGVRQSSGKEFSVSARLEVAGGLPANQIVAALGDVRQGASGISKVVLSNGVLATGEMAMLDLNFSRTDGSVPVITPYLGAIAHVVAVPLSGDQLLHVHPMEMGSGAAMLHVTFPVAGDYRLWVQFIDGGELKIIPLSVTAK